MDRGDIEGWWQRGRAAWPRISVDLEQFVAFVTERTPGPGDATERAEDLYLACAVASGARGAAQAFDAEHTTDVDATLSRMAVPPDLRDEIKQRLREKLLLAVGDRPPRIASYQGRGPLRSWVRAVAVRTAIDVLRQERSEEVPTEETLLDFLADDEVGPELKALKNRYRDEVNAAFTAAFADLEPRQRNVLRQHFVHGLSIDRISPMYQVHRVTVFRWLADAQRDLLERARRHLERAVGTNRAESESLLRLLRSQIEISLDRVLRSRG